MTKLDALRLLYFACLVLALKASTVSTDDLEKILGLAVLESLERARVTVKEAAALMKLDESHFRKQLRGEPGNHLSLTRLVRLPYAFWLWFSPSLIYLVAKKNAIEIAESVGMRHGS